AEVALDSVADVFAIDFLLLVGCSGADREEQKHRQEGADQAHGEPRTTQIHPCAIYPEGAGIARSRTDTGRYFVVWRLMESFAGSFSCILRGEDVQQVLCNSMLDARRLCAGRVFQWKSRLFDLHEPS